MNCLFRFLCFILRILFSLRYHVKIEGKESLSRKNFTKKGGILFLPNHPAHLDPIFLVLNFWPDFKMRPLAIEYIFRQSIVNFFMKLVKALPIPNFETSINEIKLKKAEESLGNIIDGLNRKEAFLLYPSGGLKHTGKEILGGASAAHTILEKCPETNVVLIRTTGLWGSSFSRALTHRSPDLKTTFYHGFKILFKNLIFFAPRRKVLIQVEVNPEGFPTLQPRINLNRYLENWYNRYPTKKGIVDVEPLTLVSYSFFRKVYPKIEGDNKKKREKERSAISPQRKEKIFAELAAIAKRPASEIDEDMNLALDLALDSLDIAQIVAFLSDHYGVGELHPEDLETVRDVLEVSEKHRKTGHHEENESFAWPKEKGRPNPATPSGKTIQEAFLRSVSRMGSFSACADDMMGPLSYRKLKTSVFVLAEELKQMPGKNIGILLPSSNAAYLVILACMMAGKIPVMLNWTIGPKFLNETLSLTKTKVVISSWRFLERLSYVEFGDLVNKMRLLEDIRQKISLKKKLTGLFNSWRSYGSIMRSFHLDSITENDTAVILFTSGTETVPKGVPLSHKNILSNLAAGIQCVNFTKEDVLYGILPPFHSFGFSVTGLFPLLIGMKVVYAPDPTDGFSLAKGILKWKVSIFISAPSFLKGLLYAAEKHDLDTVHLFVTGAEKAPPELFERIKKLGKNKILIEGYGITECSPMLTLNRPNLPLVGVGQLMPGVELCTIHPETLEPLKEHEEGEICVRGPNVFKAYIGEQKSPFIELHGKKWYRTGDLGYLDKRGNLILSGRLKRFAKIGGEMVSLGAIESVVSAGLSHLKQEEDKPNLAICVDERDASKTSLVLFTTLNVDKRVVNDILKDSGYSRLVKIAEVMKIQEIPLMGTGKTDYRKLQSMVV